MKRHDFTVVVAVDDHYLDKLWWSYQTWVKFKPEINEMPMLLICDNASLPREHGSPCSKVIEFLHLMQRLGRRVECKTVGWDMAEYADQREKMLTSLVFAPAMYVETPWYIKLDADTYATASRQWIMQKWFIHEDDKKPVFIASPWGYTKPGNALDVLDDWGDTVEALKAFPRLNVPHAPDSMTVASKRMISRVMFGNTQWLKEIVKLCPNQRLPFPSQDTFLYYVAQRRGDFWVTDRMGAFGWGHTSRLRNLVKECSALLAPDAQLPLYSLPKDNLVTT